jgi:hypothetical protein
MAKRTNRAAWRLSAGLGVVLLAGLGSLFAEYQRRLPPPDRWIMFLPRDEWGFGWDGQALLQECLAELNGGVTWPERYRLGIWTVRVDYSRRSRRCSPNGLIGFLVKCCHDT